MGIGNTLQSDDAAGSLLASRLSGRVPYLVYDAGADPENYVGKIIKDKPDNIVIIDAVDFGASPGELRLLESGDIKTANLYATHNASISLTINYLQNNLPADIIVLCIQPKRISFGDKLSPEVENTLKKLEEWFVGAEKKG
ncbi:MAG: hydrogenase maturation protease [Candidatus Omnitrophica bacterium]|nr:hydrogenase maturation protease [Candidatus Omnitrophota bacterium]